MSHVWGWYLLAAPMSVGGTLITVIVGPVLINQWFRKHNGLALGILSAVGGLIGAVGQPIVASLITNAGWRFAYISVGLVSMGIVIVVALLPGWLGDVSGSKNSAILTMFAGSCDCFRHRIAPLRVHF